MGTLHSKSEFKEKRSRPDLGIFATPNFDEFASQTRSASRLARQGAFHERGILCKKELIENLSGSEVYYANSLILLVDNMLCSKFHYQKGFFFSPYNIECH